MENETNNGGEGCDGLNKEVGSSELTGPIEPVEPVGLIEPTASAGFLLEGGALSKAMAALSPQQRMVIEQLSRGKTVVEAAREAGVSRATANRWRKEPIFLAAYNAWQEEVLQSAQSQMVALLGEATSAVRKAVERGDPRVSLVVLKSAGALVAIRPGPTEPAEVQRLADRAFRKKQQEMIDEELGLG